VSTTAPAEAAPATVLTVCACCLILHDAQVALIHRQRPAGHQYSVHGGIIHADEEVTAALARELDDELGLDVTTLPSQPELRWVQDQITARSTGPFAGSTSSTSCPTCPPAPGTPWQPPSRTPKTTPGSPGRPSARRPASTCTPQSAWPSSPSAGTRGQPAPVLLPPITDRSFRWR